MADGVVDCEAPSAAVLRHLVALACLALSASLSASDPQAVPLSFVVKNEYLSAPAQPSKPTEEGAVIEPHRPTFFTAMDNTRKLGSHALRLKIEHVEMLIERGGRSVPSIPLYPLATLGVCRLVR